jgi:hypothetical protein
VDTVREPLLVQNSEMRVRTANGSFYQTFEETDWLRRMVFVNGKIDDEERKFLHELKGEARHVSREFDVLFGESMKQPPEQRACR